MRFTHCGQVFGKTNIVRMALGCCRPVDFARHHKGFVGQPVFRRNVARMCNAKPIVLRLRHVSIQRSAVIRRFPNLGDVSMEYRWGGRLCLSRNNVQVIGELEPGLFSACCQNGLGTAKGTLAGGLAADLALGRTSPALSRALAADAPTRLPPAAISTLGANLYLRWQEGRAFGEL